MLQAQRHAEQSASAALQIQELQEQLAAEQSAKETERHVRERAEQQIAELKVPAPAAPGRVQQIFYCCHSHANYRLEEHWLANCFDKCIAGSTGGCSAGRAEFPHIPHFTVMRQGH